MKRLLPTLGLAASIALSTSASAPADTAPASSPAPAIGTPAPKAAPTPFENAFLHPATDIVIKSFKTVATSDAISGAANQEYYVVKFTFTNDLGYAFVPIIQHFYIEDIDRIRYRGEETGSSALIGISNYFTLLKVGDSHEYTAGFRVPNNTTGTLVYDPTES